MTRSGRATQELGAGLGAARTLDFDASALRSPSSASSWSWHRALPHGCWDRGRQWPADTQKTNALINEMLRTVFAPPVKDNDLDASFRDFLWR